MQNYKGFTLLELMVTLSIVGILLAVAVPASRNFQANIRVKTTSDSFVSVLKAARSQAMIDRRHNTVVSRNTATGNTSWGGSGWLVTEQVNGATVKMREITNLPNSITIESNPGLSGFRFEAITGMAQQNDAGGTALVLANGSVRFRVCDSGSQVEIGRDILINQFGRILVRNHADASVCNP
jgi:prepilin-type N-terminal cleavage/methylation domain-containing protein